MNNELLLSNKKHTDTFIEQTKARPQKTLQFVIVKQIESFSFNPPMNLDDEGKWLLRVTSFEATNFVFNITDENNSCLKIKPGHWSFRGVAEIIYKLQKLLKLTSQHDVD